MRGRRARDTSAFGLSFLDVLANTIGGLAFLLVLAMLMVGSVVFAPPTIITESLPTAYNGREYRTWLAAREGMGKFHWSVAQGAIPPGLTLDETTGRLSGVVALPNNSPDSSEFEFDVQCVGGLEGKVSSDTRRYALRVMRQAPIDATPLKLATESPLPDAYRGQNYPLRFAAEGGQPPYAWSASGGLPTGLSITPEGAIIGKPELVGAFNFQVTVRTPAGESASGNYRLTVSEKYPPPPPIPPLVIKTKRVPKAVAERDYGLHMSAEGGSPPYSWQLVRGQPRWLDPVSGAPDAFGGSPGLQDIGTSEVVWRVMDGAGNAAESVPILLEVLPPSGEKPPPLRLKTAALAEGRVGDPYHLAMSVTGGFPPYTWTASPASPFSGLSFDAPEGILAGVPEAFGNTTVNVAVADRSGQSLQVDFPLRVRPPLVSVEILTKTAPIGRAQADYHVALSAVGGLSPYRWKLEGGSLPPGLTLDEASGVIAGKPEQPGDYSIRISVADAEGTPAPAPVDLPLEIRTWKNLRPLIVTTRTVPTLLKGRPSEVALACEGGEPPYSWSASNELPAGLRLDAGRIIGTPSATAAFTTMFRVTDASGETASQSLTLMVEHVAPFWLALLLAILAALAVLFLIWLLLRFRTLTAAARAPLSIVTREIPAARASCWYSVQLACLGGMPPYRWSLSRGELPPGIELSESGELSGYPFKGINVDARKSVPFTVRVEDARGEHADAEL